MVCLSLVSAATAAPRNSVPASVVQYLDQTARDGGDVSGGDLDGDHIADLVSTVRSRHTTSGVRHVLEIRLGNGTSRQTFHFPARNGGLAVAARDVDGDRDLDLVVTARVTGEGIGILINDGTGVFTEGDLRDRKPWVWGGGTKLTTGTAEVPSPAVSPAATEDVSDVETHATLLLLQSAASESRASARCGARSRGAFYIRPPPCRI